MASRRKRDVRIETHSDYILSTKYNNSLKALLADNPNGVPDSAICRLLDISVHELRERFSQTLITLREALDATERKDDEIPPVHKSTPAQ